MRGAGSRGGEAGPLGKDDEPFSSVSRRRDCAGGVEDGKEARASATGSGVSPSKNLAIAI